MTKLKISYFRHSGRRLPSGTIADGRRLNSGVFEKRSAVSGRKRDWTHTHSRTYIHVSFRTIYCYVFQSNNDNNNDNNNNSCTPNGHSRATNDHGDGDKHGALSPVDVYTAYRRRRRRRIAAHVVRCTAYIVAKKKKNFERTYAKMHTRDYNEEDDRRQDVVCIMWQVCSSGHKRTLYAARRLSNYII